MNVLVVVAHHDDLELGCGGTVAKLVEQGHSVTGLVMTHSGFNGPDGREIRNSRQVQAEAAQAAEILGYELISLNGDTLDLPVCDANVCQILKVIQTRRIQMLMTHWHGDTHQAHRSVHLMAVHASRDVPSLLGFAVNWFVGTECFTPRVFVSITEQHFEKKFRAFQYYESEYRRSGERYHAFHSNQNRVYGLQVGVPLAEGFMAYKHLL